MRRAGAAVTGALGIALAVPSASAQSDAAPLENRALTILVVDFASVSPLMFDVMAQEAAALLSPAGVELEWKRVSASATSRSGETRLVLLADAARGGLADQVVLGSSHAARTGPTVWVYQPTVLRHVGVSDEEVPVLGATARRRVGRAFGRVVAHELIHALLPGWPHSRHGLMAQEASGSWLLRRHVTIDAETIAALRLVTAASS